MFVSICIVLILIGCTTVANDEYGYKWKYFGNPVPQSNWTYTIVRDVELACGRVRALACSKIDRIKNTCEIILPKNAPEWIVEHEEKHCRGWRH